jgi:Phage integrase family
VPPAAFAHHDCQTNNGQRTHAAELHHLRHTCLSWLGDTGANDMVIKAIAGHADADVTDRYVHVGLDAMREAVTRLEQAKLLQKNDPKMADDSSPDYLTLAAEQRRNQDSARKRAERQAAQEQGRAWQTAQTARLAEDATSCDTYRQAWSIHCTYFGSVAQHCVSLARMVAELGGVAVVEERHIRRMQRANKWLIAHGYLVRIERTERRNDGKQHTNNWVPAPVDGLRVSQDVAPLQTTEMTFSGVGVDALREGGVFMRR